MTLPWIRLDRNMSRHPKADALDDLLGERRTWSYVVELWMWAAEMRPTGDLAGLPDLSIARRAGYEGDAARFVAALIGSGWLTPDRVLHDWETYQGKRAEKAERDAEAKREKRVQTLHGDAARGRCAVGARSGDERRAPPVGDGNDHDHKEEEERGPPAPPPPPQAVPAGTPRAKTLFGQEEASRMPQTSRDVLDDHHYGPIMRKKFPAMAEDDLVLEIRSDLESFQKKYLASGRDAAYAGLISWLRRRYGSYERALKAAGGILTEAPEQDPVRRRAKDVWMRKRQSGADVGPFDSWFSAHAHEFDRPSSRVRDMVPEQHPADIDGPIDIREVMQRARPGARAGPSPAGGTIGSGATTTTAG